jgi:hypothetical protein
VKVREKKKILKGMKILKIEKLSRFFEKKSLEKNWGSSSH